jgi:hypothetical protein
MVMPCKPSRRNIMPLTLSDKIDATSYENCRLFIGQKFLMVEDVKEFIKRLKEQLFECDRVEDEEPVFEIIDKLAGDKLCR